MTTSVRLAFVETPVLQSDGTVELHQTVAAHDQGVIHSYARHLTPEDLDALALARLNDENISTIKVRRLRTRHHEIARLMVLGTPNVEIAACFNMSPVTISLLRHNPAFSDLLAFYGAERDKDVTNLSSRLRGVAIDAIDRLQDMVNDEEVATPEFVRKSLETVLDRIGHGPESSVTVKGGVDVNLLKRELSTPSVVRQRPVLDLPSPGQESPVIIDGQVLPPAGLGEKQS